MNNTQDFFNQSRGGGIDDDDFTSPGSGAGFDSGKDFIPPASDRSRDNSDRTNQNNREEESGDDDFDFDLPSLNFNPDSSIFSNDYFDIAYYRYKNPDVAKNNTGSLRHFKEFGAAEGREFRSTFDSEYYLAQNPDVAAAGVNPYLHFLITGKSEGREHRGENIIYNPLSRSDDGVPRYSVDKLTGSQLQFDARSTYLFSEDLEFKTSSDNFDRDYYLAQNPDVTTTGIDPYSHYLQFGQAEGRIPYAGFDPSSLETESSAIVIPESFNNFI